MKNQIFAILMTCLVAGCATLTVTGKAVPIGEKREPIPQSQVMVYIAAPANAVKVGTVEVVASESTNKNIGAMNLVLPELEKQAASLGANGVVQTSKQVDPATGAETHSGEAIYVPK